MSWLPTYPSNQYHTSKAWSLTPLTWLKQKWSRATCSQLEPPSCLSWLSSAWCQSSESSASGQIRFSIRSRASVTTASVCQGRWSSKIAAMWWWTLPPSQLSGQCSSSYLVSSSPYTILFDPCTRPWRSTTASSTRFHSQGLSPDSLVSSALSIYQNHSGTFSVEDLPRFTALTWTRLSIQTSVITRHSLFSSLDILRKEPEL